MFKLEKSIDFYLFFIIFIKIVFVVAAVGHFILSNFATSLFNGLDEKFVYWKERTEFVFIVSMSILLIYHFRPNHEKPVDKETATLFFLFGWILVFTAKWSIFVKEAPWYKSISQALN